MALGGVQLVAFNLMESSSAFTYQQEAASRLQCMAAMAYSTSQFRCDYRWAVDWTAVLTRELLEAQCRAGRQYHENRLALNWRMSSVLETAGC